MDGEYPVIFDLFFSLENAVQRLFLLCFFCYLSLAGGEKVKKDKSVGRTSNKGWKCLPVLGALVVFGFPFFVLSYPSHAAEGYDTTVLAVTSDKGETITWVTAKIADRPLLRYLGLSGTDRLDTGTGMWFVYARPDTRAFVMRDMNYPIDIIFVDQHRTITEIHSAPVEDTKPHTHYRGWARWVLEVPYHWARRNRVQPGDRIQPP